MEKERIRDFVNWEDVAESDRIIMYEESLGILRENISKKYTNWTSKSEYSINDTLETFVKSGRKFDRIFFYNSRRNSSNSVWGLVAKKDFTFKGEAVKVGDVFKAAGRKNAAKHVRGSIFDGSTDWFSWTGPEYMFTRKARLEN